MNKLLAIAISALLCMDAVGALKCNYCQTVGPGNVCKHVEKTCRAGKRKFCYTRLTVRDGHIRHVERGCSRICRTIKYRNAPRKPEEYMLCCDQDHCNKQKFWKD